jgi:glyoxylase I family protein
LEKVNGIGGLFFRARNPRALADLVPENYDQLPWQQQAGPTALAPFPQDTTYFGKPEQQWMINFRVANLDAIVAQLRGAGISVEVDSQEYPNGRFARLHDPEGNPIELWQPAGRDTFRS